jgi:steroid delta-isomerase
VDVVPRAEAHAARFNAAVASGEWATFVDGFAPDALLRFADARVPAAQGRAAILAAYEASPPDDTIRVLSAEVDPASPDVDVVRFGWARGGSGTMRLRWSGDLVAGLEVAFD